MKESEALITEAKDIVRNELNNCLENEILEWNVLKNTIKKAMEKFLYEKTKRRPIILPIIMEI